MIVLTLKQFLQPIFYTIIIICMFLTKNDLVLARSVIFLHDFSLTTLNINFKINDNSQRVYTRQSLFL